MQYTSHYTSPLGEILLAADMTGLTGLWFEGQKYFARCLDKEHEEREVPLFVQTKRWLDIYFSGREPDFSIPLHFTGTDFQKKVWKILCGIPYGQTVTYGQIAEQIALQTAEQTLLHAEGTSAGKPVREIVGQFLLDRGRQRMSAQAVGGAVGRNEISIIVPCHRVVGAKGKLTGYAGGLDKKEKLLTLEKADIQKGRRL